MAVLNLDVVAPETVDIAKAERTWHLDPNVPASVMVRVFRLMELEQQNPFAALEAVPTGEALDKLEAEIAAREQRYEDETLRIALGIFRHSYPETSEQELRKTFSHTERYRIVEHFFKARLGAFAEQPSGPQSTSQQPASNRVERRTATRAKTR